MKARIERNEKSNGPSAYTVKLILEHPKENKTPIELIISTSHGYGVFSTLDKTTSNYKLVSGTFIDNKTVLLNMKTWCTHLNTLICEVIETGEILVDVEWKKSPNGTISYFNIGMFTFRIDEIFFDKSASIAYATTLKRVSLHKNGKEIDAITYER